MITSNSSGSSPCSVASTAMDSPLLYEQFADHQQQQQHQQLISHKNSPPTSSSSSSSRHEQQRSGGRQQQQIDLGRGLAPIRIPSSGGVFGNAPNHHHQQQQHLGQQQQLLQQQQQQQQQTTNDNSNFYELADINTAEISLDLQVNNK